MRISIPAETLSAPMNDATTGFSCFPEMSAISRAASPASVIAWGVSSTIAASTPSSASTASSALP